MQITEIEALNTATSGANGTSLAISGFGATDEYEILIDVSAYSGPIKFVVEDSVDAFSAAEELAVRHLSGAGSAHKISIGWRELRKAMRMGTASAVMRIRIDVTGTVTYAAHLIRNAD